ncbi:hypothetical protein FORC47_p384 (plasmid) [Bacillus cereus]|nr:hypothetical protein FORC47_p384 [Bacillus cereus]
MSDSLFFSYYLKEELLWALVVVAVAAVALQEDLLYWLYYLSY